MASFCSQPVDVSSGIESVPIVIDNAVNARDVINFKYCKVNIPGPGTDSSAFEEQFAGCECRGICELESCPCLSRFGQSYDIKGRLLFPTFDSIMTQKPVIECNKMCACPKSCIQRIVQHGVQCHLEVFDTRVKGLGLRTLENIQEHSFVCEYAGEILTLKESQARAGKQSSAAMNYILVVNEHCKEDVWRTCVDPEHIGNVGRFINHSCDPNLLMIPVRVDNNVPKLSLFSLRDILAGEELTFNYSGNTKNTNEQTVPKNSDSSSLKKCLCGTQNCIGYLPFDETLYDIHVQEKT